MMEMFLCSDPNVCMELHAVARAWIQRRLPRVSVVRFCPCIDRPIAACGWFLGCGCVSSAYNIFRGTNDKQKRICPEGRVFKAQFRICEWCSTPVARALTQCCLPRVSVVRFCPCIDRPIAACGRCLGCGLPELSLETFSNILIGIESWLPHTLHIEQPPGAHLSYCTQI